MEGNTSVSSKGSETGACCTATTRRKPNGMPDDACISILHVAAYIDANATRAQVLALVGLFVHCRRERNAKFPPEVEQV